MGKVFSCSGGAVFEGSYMTGAIVDRVWQASGSERE